ncbi:MAG: alpha/beta fold hydrolase [Acidimicrobiales bacterium]
MSNTETLTIDDAELTVSRWGDGPAEIVMLHDGLGSIDQWRTIPADVGAKTGRTVLAYDRPGHGRSTPVPTGPWPADWLHTEADRLARILDVLAIDNPLIVGHSDGGSIGLLHAAATERPIRGLLTLAAHSWVEQTCFDGIVEMRANRRAIVSGLARDNAHPDALFEAWSGVWVSDEFRRWDIRPMLSTISCPVLVAQGSADEYAADAHVVETAAAIGPNADHLLLDGLGHLLHHQDPQTIVELVYEFDKANS